MYHFKSSFTTACPLITFISDANVYQSRFILKHRVPNHRIVILHNYKPRYVLTDHFNCSISGPCRLRRPVLLDRGV